MSFQFEEIPEAGPAKFLKEHRQVLKMLFAWDQKPTGRWVDYSRNLVFYWVRRDGGPGWLGGNFALFKAGRLVLFCAFRSNGMDPNICYRLSTVRLSESLDGQRAEVSGLINEGLEAVSHRDAMGWIPVHSVSLDVEQTSWAVIPDQFTKKYFQENMAGGAQW